MSSDTSQITVNTAWVLADVHDPAAKCADALAQVTTTPWWAWRAKAMALVTALVHAATYRLAVCRWGPRPLMGAPTVVDLITQHRQAVIDMMNTPRPAADWTEEDGYMLWWRFPITEPPYVGSPLDTAWVEGAYTHWTPILLPTAPQAMEAAD